MESVICFGKNSVQVGKCIITVSTESDRQVNIKLFPKLFECLIANNFLTFTDILTGFIPTHREKEGVVTFYLNFMT